MQPSENGNCGDAAQALDRPFERAIFIQSQMRTRLIVVPGMRPHSGTADPTRAELSGATRARREEGNARAGDRRRAHHRV
jgi:hypothetical protein